MTRVRLWAINVVCWTTGVVFVIGGGWVLDQFVRRRMMVMLGKGRELGGGISRFAQSELRGHNPNGSEKLTGSPPANPYTFAAPAIPIGSCCVNRPFVAS